jgi:hypothetical protein
MQKIDTLVKSDGVEYSWLLRLPPCGGRLTTGAQWRAARMRLVQLPALPDAADGGCVPTPSLLRVASPLPQLGRDHTEAGAALSATDYEAHYLKLLDVWLHGFAGFGCGEALYLPNVRSDGVNSGSAAARSAYGAYETAR